MSNEARQAVIDFSHQEGRAYLLMLSIAERAKPWGYAFPSTGDLAHLGHMSERTVQYLLRKLEAAGELRIERGIGAGHVSQYWLMVGDLHLLAHQKGACCCTFSMEAPGDKGASSDDKGAKTHPGKVQLREEKVQVSEIKVQKLEEKVQAFAPEPTEPREPTEPSTEPEKDGGQLAPPTPPPTASKPQRQKGERRELTEDYLTGTLIPRYADCWSAAEVRERIGAPLSYRGAQKYDDIEQYVNNWLRSDAEKLRLGWERYPERAPKCPRCRKPGRWPDGGGLCASCFQPSIVVAKPEPPLPVELPALQTLPQPSPHFWGEVDDTSDPDTEAARLWAKAAPAIRSAVQGNAWDVWFDGAAAVGVEGDVLTVALPTQQAAETVPKKWGALADDAAAWATGRALRLEWVSEEE